MKIYFLVYWENSDNFVWNFVFEQYWSQCVRYLFLDSWSLRVERECNWSGIYLFI